jgi:hypothetical protein
MVSIHHLKVVSVGPFDRWVFFACRSTFNVSNTIIGIEIANRKYEAMLRTELLGEDFSLDDLQTFSEDSPRTPRKLFTYGQSRSRNSEEIPVQVDSPYKAKYSTSPIGAVGQRILQSPQKLPRQISRTPVKVLDAPELQVSCSVRAQCHFYNHR